MSFCCWTRYHHSDISISLHGTDKIGVYDSSRRSGQLAFVLFLLSFVYWLTAYSIFSPFIWLELWCVCPVAECLLQPINAYQALMELSSWKSRMNLQNIWGKVIGNVLINISPSNFFSIMLSLIDFHKGFTSYPSAWWISSKDCQAVFGRIEH